MGRQGARCVDSEKVKEIYAILETLEKGLTRRIPDAVQRSPGMLFDDVEALDIVLSLKAKLSAAL